MNVLILFSLIAIIVILALIFQEIEKVVDNTFELGKFLDRQEKREVKFAKNLANYANSKKGKK